MGKMNSKKMKHFAWIFLAIAAVCILGGIVLVVNGGMKDIQNVMMWIISGALWSICGIILFITAKLKKVEEEQKPKINAFNYGKKNLHKKAKR